MLFIQVATSTMFLLVYTNSFQRKTQWDGKKTPQELKIKAKNVKHCGTEHRSHQTLYSIIYLSVFGESMLCTKLRIIQFRIRKFMPSSLAIWHLGGLEAARRVGMRPALRSGLVVKAFVVNRKSTCITVSLYKLHQRRPQTVYSKQI